MGSREIEKASEITNRDRAATAFRAGLKLIPSVGDSLDQFIFGKGDEAKWRRLFATLDEARKMNEEKGRENRTADNEDFGDFFTAAGPHIGNATNADKRKRFRDLLFNCMSLPPGDPGWEVSMSCVDTLAHTDAVSLHILALIEQARRDDLTVGVGLLNGKQSWIFLDHNRISNKYKAFDYDKVGFGLKVTVHGNLQLALCGLSG